MSVATFRIAMEEEMGGGICGKAARMSLDVPKARTCAFVYQWRSRAQP